MAQVSLRLPDDVVAAVQRQADAEGVPLDAMVARLLLERLADEWFEEVK